MAETTAVHHECKRFCCELADEGDRYGVNPVLLSIRPEYVAGIMSRTKRVEFRRRRFARKVSHIVIYSTSPEKRVVGVCKVKVTEDAPESLWERHSDEAGISEEGLRRYFKGLNSGVAILLGCFHPLSGDIGLNEIGVSRPPQSFQYITDSAFTSLQSHLCDL